MRLFDIASFGVGGIVVEIYSPCSCSIRLQPTTTPTKLQAMCKQCSSHTNRLLWHYLTTWLPISVHPSIGYTPHNCCPFGSCLLRAPSRISGHFRRATSLCRFRQSASQREDPLGRWPSYDAIHCQLNLPPRAAPIPFGHSTLATAQ
jgi:hypothetical protein